MAMGPLAMPAGSRPALSVATATHSGDNRCNEQEDAPEGGSALVRSRYCIASLPGRFSPCSRGPCGRAGELPTGYPNRPIRMIVPFPAGGPSDIVARLIGQKMSEDWGQPVVVENRPGANTLIGAQAAAKAAPDGYTLFMAIDSTLVMNQFLYKSLPYDPFNDFVPITLTAKTISVLAVPPQRTQDR